MLKKLFLIGILAVACIFATDKRQFEVIVPMNQKGTVPLIVFLHGLCSDGAVFSESFKRDWQARTNQKQFILALPLGIPGVFDDCPHMLGWGPAKEAENTAFLEQVIKQIQQDYAIDKQQIVLFGYSNGAYFAASQLQKGEKMLWTHYWLQGGGISEPIPPQAVKQPVVLQIGLKDHWHFTTVEALNQHLQCSGWKLNEALLYQTLNAGHDFSFEKFDEAYKFLLDN